MVKFWCDGWWKYGRFLGNLAHRNGTVTHWGSLNKNGSTILDKFMGRQSTCHEGDGGGSSVLLANKLNQLLHRGKPFLLTRVWILQRGAPGHPFFFAPNA